MHELRRYRRLKMPLQVEVRHPAIGTLQVPAADMADGGVFLLVDECFQLDLSESVIVRALGLGPHAEETGPPLVMAATPKRHQEIGLSFEEAASANLESLIAQRHSKHAILQSLLIINNKNRVCFLIFRIAGACSLGNWPAMSLGQSYCNCLLISLKQSPCLITTHRFVLRAIAILTPVKLHPSLTYWSLLI
ncbi:MAG: hypothetical protein ACI9E4_000100 [Pseudohongiellaceae bacterium]|jgi:hypothetical protein